nr:DUF3788 domain-containing protein [uncultured Sellimonas sp.]
MIDIKNKSYVPSLDEIAEYIHNPIFLTFCDELKTKFNIKEQIDFSGCTMEYGWNVKFKKSGKGLCTIYPREDYFTVLVVVAKKQKEAVETILPDCSDRIKEIYHQTNEGNGQRWLMIDLEDQDQTYEDVLRLINIRKNL